MSGTDDLEDSASAAPASGPLATPALKCCPDLVGAPGLDVRDGRLRVAGRDAEGLAREHGTPLFAFDLTDVTDRVRRVQAALAATGLPHRVRFALKAQRQPEVLAALRRLGELGTLAAVGVDVARRARSPGRSEHGWQAEELSFTGSNLVDRDLEADPRYPLKLNVDRCRSCGAWGGRRRAAGRPAAQPAGRRRAAASCRPVARPTTSCSSASMPRASRPSSASTPSSSTRRWRSPASTMLVIDTVGVHVCHQMHDAELPQLDEALAVVAGMVEHLRDAGCPIEEINTGGGLGEPMMEGETDLDLDAWAAVLARRLGPLGRRSPPSRVSSSLRRAACCWPRWPPSRTAWHDVRGPERRLEHGGAALRVGRVGRGRACRSTHSRRAPAPVTIAGHINEAPDLFAEDYAFPAVAEGDIVALLNAGSYCQAAGGSTACGRWRRPSTSRSAWGPEHCGPAAANRPAGALTAPARETSGVGRGRGTGRTRVLGDDPQVAAVDAHLFAPPAGVDRPALQHALDPPAPLTPYKSLGRAGQRTPDDGDGGG